jgi:gliding motility-associated-like protein
MTRIYLLVTLVLMISIKSPGQCANSPTVILSITSSSICGTKPVTVAGNSFGGSAKKVTIKENGAGSVSPTSASKSPFTFTYTPKNGDFGKQVIITVTTDNPLGSHCSAAIATYSLSVNDSPSAPVVGAITSPSCSVATGSVVMSSLPSTGTWTLTRSPDGITTTGSGTSARISGLPPGTYNFTVTNSAGCISSASSNVNISAQSSAPKAPVIVTITQPTCTVSTGNVIFSGLPSTGTWTLIRTPGGVTTTGSGTSAVISNLAEGSYTYTVTNSIGCISSPSPDIVITSQPVIPAAPIVGSITTPTCSSPTGSVVLSGLPATGTWTLIRYPGTVASSGTGTSITLSNLPGGVYNFTLTTTSGCVSVLSTNVIIPSSSLIPLPPVIGAITQPVNDLPTGSVVLNGLPESGSWTLTLTPGNMITSGTGITKTISGLSAGTYSFTVTNSLGCTSVLSASFVINALTGTPPLLITNPAPVCFPSTVDITDPKITAGSALNLTYTYWSDAAATIQYRTPGAATDGTFYIKGVKADGSFIVKPVIILVYKVPLANAGPDQVIAYPSGTTMNAELAHSFETGLWTLISGTCDFFDATYPKTSVSGLSKGKNVLLWTVTNGVCSVSSDSVLINVRDLVVPTLITPNMDGKNDYFILKGSDGDGKKELVIFDRRGVQVYENANYDNSWNGVDYKGNPLPDDTYFYVLKIGKGTSVSGYIVVRR